MVPVFLGESSWRFVGFVFKEATLSFVTLFYRFVFHLFLLSSLPFPAFRQLRAQFVPFLVPWDTAFGCLLAIFLVSVRASSYGSFCYIPRVSVCCFSIFVSIFFLISPLIHWLLRRMVFNFQVFEFLAFLLLLMSRFLPELSLWPAEPSAQPTVAAHSSVHPTKSRALTGLLCFAALLPFIVGPCSSVWLLLPPVSPVRRGPSSSLPEPRSSTDLWTFKGLMSHRMSQWTLTFLAKGAFGYRGGWGTAGARGERLKAY